MSQAENRVNGVPQRPSGPTRYGIVDLHSHFPMHLAADPGRTLTAMRRRHGRSCGDVVRATVLDLACRIANYEDWDAGPAVTIPALFEGRVGAALSVLYQPFDEMDPESEFQAAPRSSYFADLLAELERVEHHVRSDPTGAAVFCHNPSQLESALDGGRLALVHAVEGGFHLGDNPRSIAQNVRELAARGVAYITIAHLFWRGFATNAPALPFLSDAVYRFLFPEPELGLSPLGDALLDAMVEERMLIDITHMSERAITHTLARLPKTVPVIASHSACRAPGGLAYNLSEDNVRAIANRGGVIGIILCAHYVNDGQVKAKSFDESTAIICSQIDRIYNLTGSYDQAAIGTDLDGFIKPTLTGFGDPRALARLEVALCARYGVPVATKICSGNALRLLLSYWRGGISPSGPADIERGHQVVDMATG